MRRLLAAVLIISVLAPCSPAWGEARTVKPGDVITEDGVFLPAKDALEAAEMMDRYKGLVDQVAAMDKKLKDQGEEIDNLVRQMGSSERELALKDMVIKLKDEMLAFRKELNEEYRTLLSEGRKQMENDRETIKRMEAKIEAQAKRGIWTTIGAFLLGLAVTVVSHGLL